MTPTSNTHLSRRRFLAATGIAAASALLGGCSPDAFRPASQPEQASTTLFAFDTAVTLTGSCSREVLDVAAERCRYFESIFSRTIATSDIGRVNSAGGVPVEVAPETAELVSVALRYCEESGGMFDITIGAVSSLWDFKAGVVPDAEALSAACAHGDWRQVRVRDATVQLLDDQAKLDLGGIAKGYIADDLCALLGEAGCTSACVNLGGNVKTLGRKPDGRPWRVGIQDPGESSGTAIAAVESQGSSAVTSGLYERRFERDGKRYWHILDPRTGYPVQTDIASATIISSASIDGDGYTKPLFMKSPAEALSWIENQANIEGVLVASDGTILASKGSGVQLL